MTRWARVRSLVKTARGETELGGVGARDHLLLVFELQHRHHRAEDLLAHDVHVVVAAIEHRRRDEEAARQIPAGHARAAAEQPRALGAPARDVPEHLFHVLARK